MCCALFLLPPVFSPQPNWVRRSSVLTQRACVRSATAAAVTTQLGSLKLTSEFSRLEESAGASAVLKVPETSLQKTSSRGSGSAEAGLGTSNPHSSLQSRGQRRFFTLEAPLQKPCRSRHSSGRQPKRDSQTGKRSYKKPTLEQTSLVYPDTEGRDLSNPQGRPLRTKQFIPMSEQAALDSGEPVRSVHYLSRERSKPDSASAVPTDVEPGTVRGLSAVTSHDGSCREQVLLSAPEVVSISAKTQLGGDSVCERVEKPKAMRQLIGFVTTGRECTSSFSCRPEFRDAACKHAGTTEGAQTAPCWLLLLRTGHACMHALTPPAQPDLKPGADCCRAWADHSLLRGRGFGVGCVAADGFLAALRIHLRALCGPMSSEDSEMEGSKTRPASFPGMVSLHRVRVVRNQTPLRRSGAGRTDFSLEGDKPPTVSGARSIGYGELSLLRLFNCVRCQKLQTRPSECARTQSQLG